MAETQRQKKKTRKEVKESLLSALRARGADCDHDVDLVDDYMALWDSKVKLIADIKKRGVNYEDYSSVGVKMRKSNPSVKELVMVNRQMLAIRKELGLSAVEGYDDTPL